MVCRSCLFVLLWCALGSCAEMGRIVMYVVGCSLVVCGGGVIVSVCAWSSLSACSVMVNSMLVMIQKVRCNFIWRLACMGLTSCVGVFRC